MRAINIAVDIDWIITNEAEWWIYENKTPNKEVIEIINWLHEDWNTIILYTARDIVDKKITLKWLEDNWVKYDDIIFWKPKYDILIDDRAVNNLDWLNEMLWKFISQE